MNIKYLLLVTILCGGPCVFAQDDGLEGEVYGSEVQTAPATPATAPPPTAPSEVAPAPAASADPALTTPPPAEAAATAPAPAPSEEFEPIPPPNDSANLKPSDMNYSLGFNFMDSSSTEITKEGMAVLKRLAADLKTQKDFKSVTVEGHSDNEGGESTNQQLSLKRAQRVRQALMAMGVPGKKIKTSGVGSVHPIAPNSTEQGRALNRRVEFHVVWTDADEDPSREVSSVPNK